MKPLSFKILITLLSSLSFENIFCQNLIPYLKSNGKYSYINVETEEVVTEYNFDLAGTFKNGLAIVEIGSIQTGFKKGIIDNEKIILPIKYDVIGDIEKNFIFVGKGDYREKFQKLLDGQGGFIDRKGKFIIPLNANIKSGFSFNEETTFIENEEGKKAVIDKSGNSTTGFIYDNIIALPNKQYEVEVNNKHGVINEIGKILIPIKYSSWISTSGDNYFKVELNNKIGFIDSTNKIKIPFKFDGSWRPVVFSEGLAPVSLNGKYGYINKLGVVIIPFKYDNADNFKDGIAIVKLNGKSGCINNKGILKIPLKYYEIYHVNKEYVIALNLRDPNEPPGFMIDGVYGVISLETGQPVIPLKFDWIEHIKNNIFSFTQNQVKWSRDIDLRKNYTTINGVENYFRNYCPEELREISTNNITGTARRYTAKDGQKYYEVKLTVNPNLNTKKFVTKIIATRMREYTTETRYVTNIGKIGGEKAINKIEYSIKASNGTLVILGCIEGDVFQVEGIYSCETGRFKGPSATIYFRDLRIIQ